MAAVDIFPLVDEGLGNSAYLVDLGDGRALAVDVSIDLRAARQLARRRGLALAYAADTHLHADFISGVRQLATTEGTRILASATGQREFAHTGLHDDDVIDLGGLRLRALTTPGHTHEHLAFLLTDGNTPVGVFTGGSLLVGAAARTDLVSADQTEALARQQYASLRRLATLPDDVAVWPTHGAGSFCSAPPGAERTSTIGREKATNPLLQIADEDTFVTTLIDSLGSFPPYFLWLADTNRRGPEILDGSPGLAPLGVSDVRSLLADGARMVDVRAVPEFAAAHVPGAVSIPLRPAFASWLGWLAPHDRPLVFLRSPEQDPAEIVWQAAKIGYTDIAGELAGGMSAWTAAGQAATSTRLVNADQIGASRVLDIRQRSEFTTGHIPGAVHIELGSVAQHVDAVPQEPTVVMCGHGERAMGAASLLEEAGHRQLAVLIGGPHDWSQASGRHLATGA